MNYQTLILLSSLIAAAGCSTEEHAPPERSQSDSLTLNCNGFPGWTVDPASVDSLRRYAREFPSTGARYASVCQAGCWAWGRRVSASGERYDFRISATGELNIYEDGDTTYYVCEDYRCYRFLHFYHGHKSPDVLLSPAACSPAGEVDTLVIDRGYGEEGDVLVVLSWTPSDVSSKNVPMVAHAWLRAAGVSGLVWDDVYGIGRRILQELPEGAQASRSNYLALTLLDEQRSARGVMLRRNDGEVMFHLCEEYDH